ncbi:ABC transporter permease [Marinicella sp. W31]|uniref:ABC transporter permease n=1 Tax=Marinicella sp. W31 TaxID=3023713 RepID=UPI00375827A8
MNLFSKEWKTSSRSAAMWVVLAIFSLIAAWIFWILMDGYVQSQGRFSQLPNPPSVTEVVFLSFIKTLAILMIFVVSIVSSLAFASEKRNGTLALLLQNRRGDWHTIRSKYKALLLQLLLFLTPLILVLMTLYLATELHERQVICAIIGLLLMMMWMAAFGLWFSLLVPNTAAAVLLSFLVFASLWVFGQTSLSAAEWGKNWLIVLSPAYHLQQFHQGQLPLASLWYFLGGAFTGILLAKQALNQQRSQLI